jgi:hypothetical protein
MSEFRPRTWPTSYTAGGARNRRISHLRDLAGILGPIMIGDQLARFLAAIILSVAVNLAAALIFAAAPRETVPRGQR